LRYNPRNPLLTFIKTETMMNSRTGTRVSPWPKHGKAAILWRLPLYGYTARASSSFFIRVSRSHAVVRCGFLLFSVFSTRLRNCTTGLPQSAQNSDAGNP
jgi:hypothetical protein